MASILLPASCKPYKPRKPSKPSEPVKPSKSSKPSKPSKQIHKPSKPSRQQSHQVQPAASQLASQAAGQERARVSIGHRVSSRRAPQVHQIFHVKARRHSLIQKTNWYIDQPRNPRTEQQNSKQNMEVTENEDFTSSSRALLDQGRVVFSHHPLFLLLSQL